MSYSCVILCRVPTSDRVFALGDDGKIAAAREFSNRDAAIAYVEEVFTASVPYQIVELDEL